jgi:hypothetical protein
MAMGALDLFCSLYARARPAVRAGGAVAMVELPLAAVRQRAVATSGALAGGAATTLFSASPRPGNGPGRALVRRPVFPPRYVAQAAQQGVLLRSRARGPR